MFNRLGETVNLDENSIKLLEEFVCSMHKKSKKISINFAMTFFKQCTRRKVKTRLVSSSTLQVISPVALKTFKTILQRCGDQTSVATLIQIISRTMVNQKIEI